MSDTMGPVSFERLLDICLEDYHTKSKIFEIEEKYFYKPKNRTLEMNFHNEYLRIPIGPAAGSHTQLSQNILSAYLTGSRFFELKTVQVVDGKQMQELVPKPCIDAKNVGYNTEWSSELTVEEARNEYIKASVLLEALAIELGLSDVKDFVFNISVGYDLAGIQSKKISGYIDDMKDAKNTEIFQECIDVLKKNSSRFKRLTLEDIDTISSNITNSIALSTMHGCRPEEILAIGSYLLTEKRLHTFIKLNPTLLGYEKVREILDGLGYEDVEIRKEDFEKDLQYDDAVEILKKLMELGKKAGVSVGIKLTNTLPVVNHGKGLLSGESMYLSGAPLYPIAIGVADKFAQSFHGDIHISFSGGIGKNNIKKVLKAGIAPVTFSTILLKPRGFINMKDILKETEGESFSFDRIDVEALKELAESAKRDENFKNPGDKRIMKDTLPTYDCFKVNCGICVDVCPNRANIKLFDESFNAPYQIIHIENRCYECGNCHTFCTRGGYPYFKKVTLFPNLEEYRQSKNPGILKTGENRFKVRDESGVEYDYDYDPGKGEKPEKEIERIIASMMRDYPYLMVQGNM